MNCPTRCRQTNLHFCVVQRSHYNGNRVVKMIKWVQVHPNLPASFSKRFPLDSCQRLAIYNLGQWQWKWQWQEEMTQLSLFIFLSLLLYSVSTGLDEVQEGVNESYKGHLKCSQPMKLNCLINLEFFRRRRFNSNTILPLVDEERKRWREDAKSTSAHMISPAKLLIQKEM